MAETFVNLILEKSFDNHQQEGTPNLIGSRRPQKTTVIDGRRISLMKKTTSQQFAG